MIHGNPAPRSLVIRWPPARDPHWLGVQTAPGVLKPGTKAKVHLVHYEPGGRFELRPSGCQWGGGGNDSLNHRSWLYILFTLAARFRQAPTASTPDRRGGFNAPYWGHTPLLGRWGG